MAAKTPIRTVYTNNVATGLAEFQSGEFIDYGIGGTGLTALGSAGQVLKVNSGASALEFGEVAAILNIDAMTDGSGATLAATDKFAFSDGGTEKYLVASQIDTYVSGTTATLTNKTLTTPQITSGVLNTGVSGSAIKDQDDMSSDSATHLATQQSIKAYVDAQVTAEDLDVTTDSGTIAIDLDSETLTVSGGTGLDSSATGNAITLAIDSTVATLTGTQTLTNKTLTSPTITGGTFSGTFTGTQDLTGVVLSGASPLVFEGATADAYETTLAFTDPTADRTITFFNATDTLIGKATTDTLTNKSFDLGGTGNSLTGSLAEFNTALQSDSFVSLTGTETLTNKTLTNPTINAGTFSGTFTGTMDDTGVVLSGASPLVFEGATDDGYETTLAFTDPTADRTITVPNATDTLVGRATTDTLTNKSIDFGGTGNSITGSLAEWNTALQSNSFVSLTGSETLTNKTLTSPTINTPTITSVTATALNLTDSSIVFEGATADAYETTLTVVDPTADRTITLPNETGTLMTTTSAATNSFSIALAAALG